MRIAFVHPAFMDYRFGLFNKLNKQFDVTFIFTRQGRGQDDVKENHLDIPSEWNYKIMRNDSLVIKGREIIAYFKLAKELFIGNYDIIFTSTFWYICFPIARIRGKKFILLTEYWYLSSNSISRKLLNLVTKFIARKSDAIITTGSKSYELHLNFGVNPIKIFKCVQSAKDYSNSEPKDLRNELGLKEKKIILYLGRIVQRKGLDYLIRAYSLLEKNNNVALLIVGEGPFRIECENIAKKLEIKNVFFMGFEMDKSSYYKTCDIFVLPAIMDNKNGPEPWGLVINEAIAFGKPIVATDAVGSAFDLVINGFNGYIVKNKDVKALYEAILKICSNYELFKIMGENSKKIFNNKNSTDDMFEAFEKAINYSLIK